MRSITFIQVLLKRGDCYKYEIQQCLADVFVYVDERGIFYNLSSVLGSDVGRLTFLSVICL